MIDIHRGRGDLAAALQLCRRLVRLDPGHRKARWLSAVLGGGTVPEQKPSGPWPAPFVRIPDFLAPAEGERLLTSALALGRACALTSTWTALFWTKTEAAGSRAWAWKYQALRTRGQSYSAGSSRTSSHRLLAAEILSLSANRGSLAGSGPT